MLAGLGLGGLGGAHRSALSARAGQRLWGRRCHGAMLFWGLEERYPFIGSSPCGVRKKNRGPALRVVMAEDRWSQVGKALMQVGALSIPIGLLISVALCYVSFAFLMLGALCARVRLWQMPGFWVLLAFSAWMLLITFVHGYRLRGLVYVWPLIYVLAVGMALPTARRWAPWVLLAALVAAGFLAILQFTVGLGGDRPWRVDADGPQWRRVVGFFSHHIRFGSVMSFVAILLTISLSPSLPRWLQAAGAVFAAMLALISSARGQILGLLVGLWLRFVGRGWKRFALSVGMVLIVAALGAAFLQWSQPARLQSLLAFSDVRWGLWALCLDLWRSAPLLGIGEGLNEALRASFAPEILRQHLGGWMPGHAHNTFISLGLLYGAPAALLFIAWLLVLLRALWLQTDQAPALRGACMGVMAVFVVGGLTEDLSGLASSRFGFLVVLGWLWALLLAREKTSAESSPALISPPPSTDTTEANRP
ncbi:MAG: O-antigen ligase family protein [Planctomycetota bacterium]|nr:MAG: O-antigen ligase family protein [Planctomycetota bacterium]